MIVIKCRSGAELFTNAELLGSRRGPFIPRDANEPEAQKGLSHLLKVTEPVPL